MLRRGDAAVGAHQLKDLAPAGVFDLRRRGMVDDLAPAERQSHAETAVDTFLRTHAAALAQAHAQLAD